MKAVAMPIQVVIPDAGPLISLAVADALNLLLVFGDRVRIVVTDFVEFEVTRRRDQYDDGRRIAGFLSRHAGRIEIQATAYGQVMKQAALNRERFEVDAAVRASLSALGMEPAPLPRDAGELSIVSYANELIVKPPGTPVLILAEDDFFLSFGSRDPGNIHILSTRAFLDTLEVLGKIKHADTIWRRIQEARPDVNGARVDRVAGKINTTWTDTLEPAGTGGGSAGRTPRKKAAAGQKAGR